MTGQRKARARYKALDKFQNSMEGVLNYDERFLFFTGFNMGWRQGKKRQRQISNRDNFKQYYLIAKTSPFSIILKLQNHMLDVLRPLYTQQKKIATAEMELEKVSNCGLEEKEISLGCEEPSPSFADIIFNKKKRCWGFK